MAVLQIDYFSEVLKRKIEVMAVIPAEKRYGKAAPYRSLYLLHGYTGYARDWLYDFDLAALANDYGIAIFCPTGENGFYTDNPDAALPMGSYIGEELIAFTRSLFPLSERREDTMIGGLSMGGFGAVRLGLRYHHTFGKIISMSAALITDEYARGMDYEHAPEGEAYYLRVFGTQKAILESDNNPRVLAKTIVERKEVFPDLFLTCGSEDFLIEPNRAYRDYLRSLGVDFTYVEAPGVHDLNFWRPKLREGIEWALSR